MSLRLRCAELGLACRGSVEAADEAALVQKVREHARDAHDVELTETLVDYARAHAEEV